MKTTAATGGRPKSKRHEKMQISTTPRYKQANNRFPALDKDREKKKIRKKKIRGGDINKNIKYIKTFDSGSAQSITTSEPAITKRYRDKKIPAIGKR